MSKPQCKRESWNYYEARDHGNYYTDNHNERAKFKRIGNHARRNALKRQLRKESA